MISSVISSVHDICAYIPHEVVLSFGSFGNWSLLYSPLEVAENSNQTFWLNEKRLESSSLQPSHHPLLSPCALCEDERGQISFTTTQLLKHVVYKAALAIGHPRKPD